MNSQFMNNNLINLEEKIENMPPIDLISTFDNLKGFNSTTFTTNEDDMTNQQKPININVYKNVVTSSNICYIVHRIYDRETDIIVTDDNIRRELIESIELTDITLYDEIFNSILHDIYINFFYPIFTTRKTTNDGIETLKQKYNEVCSSSRFRSFLFGILNIEEKLDLQQRYLHHAYEQLTRRLQITANQSLMSIQKASNKELLIETIANNYYFVIIKGKYKTIGKYVNGDDTTIYINNSQIRHRVYQLLDEYKNDNLLFDCAYMYEFEETEIPIIARLLYDNFICDNIIFRTRSKYRQQCEKYIYNNHECIKMIKNGLGDKSSLCYDYINIIINNIINIASYNTL